MDKPGKSDRVKHLYNRASFGSCYAELKRNARTPIKTLIKQLLQQAEKPLPLLVISAQLPPPDVLRSMSEEAVREYLRQRNRQERELNVRWVETLINTQSPFLEKMTLFWHGHFACRSNNAFFLQQLNNIHRTNALGNFRTMLVDVSKSAAMLSFLNNRQNRKAKPNENFARELMELFTLGRGNYTEKDVKESARAFTGWQFYPPTGEFRFNKSQHDYGVKEFFGKRGNFTGEDIIDMILAKKQTAYFISEKFYKFFVNDIPDPENVKKLADVFYDAGYEIKPAIEYLFTADWFYNRENVGNKIKSPVEFLVGVGRQFHVNFKNPEVLFPIQRSLGQTLFFPPNVAGWTGGRSWIDSSTLLTRMKLPSVLLNSGNIDLGAGYDPEDEALVAAQRRNRNAFPVRIQSNPDWARFLNEIPDNISKEELAYLLLAPPANPRVAELQFKSIKDAAIQLISTPEYQLC